MGMIVRNEKTYTGISSASLSTLTDVALETPVNGQGLVYNEETQTWTNGNVASGEISGGSYFPEYFYRVVTTSTSGTEASIKIYKYNYLSGEILKEKDFPYLDVINNPYTFDNSLIVNYNTELLSWELTTLIWLIDEETNQEYLKNDKLLTWSYATSIDKKYRTVANLENDLLTLKNDVTVELTTPTTADSDWVCSLGIMADVGIQGTVFVYLNDNEDFTSTIDLALNQGTNTIDSVISIPTETSKIRFITTYGYIISVRLYIDDKMPYLTGDITELEDGIYTVSGSSIYSSYATYGYWQPFKENNNCGIYECWHPAQGCPQWYMLELPEPRAISRFIMYNRLGYAEAPHEVTFQGSNDGELWVDLKDFIFSDKSAGGQSKEVFIGNNRKFSKYRWYAHSAWGDNYAVIAKIDLYFMKDTVYKTFIDNNVKAKYTTIGFSNIETSKTDPVQLAELELNEGLYILNGRFFSETSGLRYFLEFYNEKDAFWEITSAYDNSGYVGGTLTSIIKITEKTKVKFRIYTNKSVTIATGRLNAVQLDYVDASSSNSQSLVNYSTEEQIIGTWIDGSTLYQKTYTGTFASNNTTSSAIDFIDVSSLNIKDLIELNMILYSETLGQSLKTPFYLASNNLAYPWYNVIDNNIGAFVGTVAGSGTYKLTIQYIK